MPVVETLGVGENVLLELRGLPEALRNVRVVNGCEEVVSLEPLRNAYK